MASRSHSSSRRHDNGSTPAAENVGQVSVDAAVETTRRQLALATDGMARVCRANDVLLTLQAELLERSTLLFSEATQALRTASSPMAIWSIQAGLVAAAFQESLRYNQELLVAGAKLDVEGYGISTPPEDAAVPAASAAKVASTAANAAMSAAAPMMQLWQSWVAPSMNAGHDEQRRH